MLLAWEQLLLLCLQYVYPHAALHDGVVERWQVRRTVPRFGL